MTLQKVLVQSRRFATANEGNLRIVRDEPPDARAPTDAELIEAFERGDGRACELIYDRLIGVVRGTLYRVMGTRDAQHEDLVQGAFEQIVLTLSRRRFARACSLSSWATSVTTHVALNAIRSRTREKRVIDRTADGAPVSSVRSKTDLESEVESRQALGRVRFHLSQMNEGRATTLFLHDVLGHSVEEIAILTDRSISATKSRLKRGRKELKRRLRDEGVLGSGDGSNA